MEKSPSFHIKVISDNLILVEADGFDREIFQPYIKNGKIQIFNLIPAKENPIPKVYTRKHNIFGDLSNNGPDATKKIQILQNISIKPSLPIQLNSMQFKLENLSQNDTENWNPSFTQPAADSINRSPIASKPLIQSTPLKVNKSSPVFATPSLGPNVKVIRLHRKPTTNTPRKVAKVRPNCNTPSNSNRSTLTTSTPVYSRHARRPPLPPPTITKWRNCITPLKTYSRFAKKFVRPINSPGLLKRHDLLAHHNKYRRSNNTQGFYGELLAGFKRITTKIDLKTAISPARFKAQLRNWSDITKTRDDEILPKTKAEYCNAAEGFSYDLITHSARNRCYAQKLQRMFRKRCVQKFAPTDRRIKHLVEPLEPLEYMEPRLNTRRQLLI